MRSNVVCKIGKRCNVTPCTLSTCQWLRPIRRDSLLKGQRGRQALGQKVLHAHAIEVIVKNIKR